MGSCGVGSGNSKQVNNNSQLRAINNQGSVQISGGKNKQEPVNSKSIRDNQYPIGSCIILKKIKGKTISTDNLKSKLELYVNVLSLPLPGPYVVDFTVFEGKFSQKIGQLPSQQSDSNNQINYSGCIEMEYYFERDQSLEMKFINRNSNTIYTVLEKVGKLASSLKKKLILQDTANLGFEAEFNMIPIKSQKKVVTFIIEILGPNRESDPKTQALVNNELFYVLKNFNDGQNWRGVYKSEESKNFKFNSINIFEDDLFLGDESKKFLIELFCKGSSTPIGKCSISIKEIKESDGVIALLEKPNSNDIICHVGFEIKMIEQLKFTELLKKGLEISMMLGIDFTASNGKPSDPKSLHYCGGREPNSYETATRTCGNILAYYDSDQNFPLFGFGGMPFGSNETLHVFPLNFESNPCVSGVNGIIEAYKSALSKTELSGPTYFAPLLKNLSDLARKSPNGMYFVIMIMTDGEINDMLETIDAIIECSLLPISIIIIGVGNSKFENMETLDGDDMPLRGSDDRCIKRDIVQFVPYSKYEKDPNKLAEEVLKELPEQIEIYYRNESFKSNSS